MKDLLSDEQNEAILKALNEAIDGGPWEKSGFLKAIGKKLVGIRDDFLNQLGGSSPAQLKVEATLAQRMAMRSGQQEIFISLYSSDGASLDSWGRIVANLPRQIISRPVYAEENDLKEIIKTKENKQNEAYVAIFVNRSDILTLHPNKIMQDKLGKSLLNLKDKTVNLDNISRFVHISGVYEFVRGKLIKIS